MAGKPPAESNDKRTLPSLKDLIGTKDQSEQQTEYLSNIDSSFSEEIIQIQKLERSVNAQMSHEFQRLRVILDTSFKWTKIFSLKYQALSFLQRRKERKIEKKKTQREDDLSVRQIDALSIVGEQLSFDLGVIQKLLAQSRKSKEEQKEQQAFLRGLVGGIGDSISESISKLKLTFPQKKKSWLWTLIKGIVLVAAAYVYRAWKILEPAVLFLRKNVLGRITALFKKGGIFARLGSWIARIGGVFGRLFKAGGPLAKIGTILAGFFPMIKRVFSTGFLSIVSKFKNFFRYVPVLGWIITAVEGVVGAFRGWFGSEGQPLFTRIGKTIQGFFAQILSGLSFGFLSFEDIMSFFDSVTTAIGDFFYKVYEFYFITIPNIAVSAYEGIKSFFGNIYDFFAVTIPTFFSSAYDNIANYFTVVLPDRIRGVVDIAKSFFTETIPNFFASMINNVSMTINGIKLAALKFLNDKTMGWIPGLDSVVKELEGQQKALQEKSDELNISGDMTKKESEALKEKRQEQSKSYNEGLDATLQNIEQLQTTRQGATQSANFNKPPVGSNVLAEDGIFRGEKSTSPQTTNNANVSTQINNIMSSEQQYDGDFMDATDRPNSIYAYTPSYAY